MSEKEQLVKSEAAPLDIFNNQFPAFTNQIVNIVRQLSDVAEKGPTILLMTLGASLLIMSVLMKIDYRGARIAELSPAEFITMIVVSSLLMIAGALLRMYQSKNWREITQGQQEVGAGILNKQIDIAKVLLTPKPEKTY